MYRYFKQVTEVGNGNYVYYWNCVYLLLLLFDERINSIKITNHILLQTWIIMLLKQE